MRRGTITIFQHYKGGIYKLITFAKHTETDESMTVYEDAEGNIFTRPTKMFMGSLEVDGVKVERFKLLGTFNNQ